MTIDEDQVWQAYQALPNDVEKLKTLQLWISRCQLIINGNANFLMKAKARLILDRATIELQKLQRLMT